MNYNDERDLIGLKGFWLMVAGAIVTASFLRRLKILPSYNPGLLKSETKKYALDCPAKRYSG